MTSKSTIKSFFAHIKLFEELDKSKFYRIDLGNSSLESEVSGKFDSMISMLKIENYQLIDFLDSDLNQIINSLQTLIDFIGKEATRTNAEFLSERKNVLNNANAQIDSIMQHKPKFKIAKIDDILLDDVKKIRKEYEDLKAKLDSDSKVVRESASIRTSM